MNDPISILKKLIEFKTLSHDHAINREALEWVRDLLPKMKGGIQSVAGFPSLYLSTRDSGKPDLLLAAHIDVVEGDKEDFIPYEKEGRIYGRGAFDMKFAIAAYISVLNRLLNMESVDIGLLITSDEEVGGINGTKVFVDSGMEPKLVILPDGGKNWGFKEASKGVWHLCIESEGKAGHGAYPWEGENAISKLISFLADLGPFFPSEPCGDKEHRHSTLNIGKIEGGLSVNRIPDRAQVFLDIRFVSPEERERIAVEIARLTGLYPGISFKTIMEGGAHNIINRNNHHLVSFADVIKAVCGIDQLISISHGSSDARFFAAKRIPVIMTRPRGGGAHGKEEWIDAEDVNRFTEIIEKFIKKEFVDKKGA